MPFSISTPTPIRSRGHTTGCSEYDYVPPPLSQPDEGNNSTEKLINIPVSSAKRLLTTYLMTDGFQHSFMVTDHKQSFRADEDLSVEERARVPWEDLWKAEEKRRATMRREMFPDLSQ